MEFPQQQLGFQYSQPPYGQEGQQGFPPAVYAQPSYGQEGQPVAFAQEGFPPSYATQESLQPSYATEPFPPSYAPEGFQPAAYAMEAYPPAACLPLATGLVDEYGQPMMGGTPLFAAPLEEPLGSMPAYHTPQSAFPGMGVGLSAQMPLVIIPLCRKGDRAGIEKQLQAGATVRETDVEGNTPLHVAVEAPKNEIATVQCLLENGSDANALNYIGAAPLHYVCLRKSNYRGVANILLENGAQINRQTVAGKSPLHFACENQLPELVEVLCLFGADTNLADIDGNTPVHLTLLKEGGRDTVKRQILEHLVTYTASVAYANSEGSTPLHLACQAGYIRCVQFLVERITDVAAVTRRGQNGLHLACLYGHAQVAQLILQVYPASLDSADCEGNTPLHCCASVGNLDCAVLLLKMNADTAARNIQRKTAFELSKIRGTDLNNTHNPELVQVLKDAKKGGTCRQS